MVRNDIFLKVQKLGWFDVYLEILRIEVDWFYPKSADYEKATYFNLEKDVYPKYAKVIYSDIINP